MGAHTRRTSRWIILAALALLVAGCGVYSTKQGRPKEGLETVAVPIFENRTSEPGIEVELTEDIVTGLLDERTVRVADEASADAVLLATVRRYSVGESFFGADRTAEQYRVQITVEVEFRQTGSNEVLAGPETLNETRTYSVDDGAQAEADARQEVIDGIVRKISGMVLETW